LLPTDDVPDLVKPQWSYTIGEFKSDLAGLSAFKRVKYLDEKRENFIANSR
jgi:hypothetical protein